MISMTQGWLESWVENNARPNWYNWLGLYPHKKSVDAARGLLKAIDNNIMVTQEEALEIFIK